MKEAITAIILMCVLVAVMTGLWLALTMPKDNHELIAICDFQIPMWRVKLSSDIGMYKDYLIRMTPEEIAQECDQ